MKHTDKIDNLIKKEFKQKAGPELDQRINELVARSAEKPTTWRIVMQKKSTKLALAAVVFIAVVLGISFLPGNQDSLLFANVMDNVFTVNSVRYDWHISKEGWEHGYTCMINDQCVKRTEVHDGDTLMHDFKTDSHFQLFNGIKHAVLNHRVGQNQNKHPFWYLDWISRLHQKDAAYTGTETLDGKTLEVYVEKLDYEETKIWVDPDTDLPYRIVIESYPNQSEEIKEPELQLSDTDFGGTSGYTYSFTAHNKNSGIQERRTQVFSKFEWNVKLDDSLFAFEAPEGYTFEEKKTVAQNNYQRDWLIEALAFWTDQSDGAFPDDISDLVNQEKARALLIKKYDQQSDPKEELDRAQKMMHILVNASLQAQELIADDNWNYNGSGQTFGDPDTPICWWQKETEQGIVYEVIYGDLSKVTLQNKP